MSNGIWWPWELGAPTASGIWGLYRFAYFSSKQVLAVKCGGNLTYYDTAGLEFRGAAELKVPPADFIFLSQHGEVSVNHLPTCELTSVSITD